MRIIFAGTPETAIPSLDSLISAGHDVAAVITRAPARAGRKHTLSPSAIHEHAITRGLTVLTPSSLRDPAFYAQCQEIAPDAVAVVAYGKLIPRPLLELPRFGWINLHFSLLPDWRGAAPVQYAIAAGDEVTGATTFLLNEGLDTGPVVGHTTEVIRPDDTADSLLHRLSLSGADLLTRTMSAIESGVASPQPQAGNPTFAPSISVADAQIDWHHPAIAIDRMIRAYTSSPGAWTLLDGTRIKLGPVTGEPTVTDLLPGEIRGTLVGTGSHAVALRTIAPAGKRAMSADDWARGARLAAGTTFTSKELTA